MDVGDCICIGSMHLKFRVKEHNRVSLFRNTELDLALAHCQSGLRLSPVSPTLSNSDDIRCLYDYAVS